MDFDAKSNRQCIYCHNFCKFSCPSFNATKDHKILQTNKNYLLYLHRQGKTGLEPADGRSFYLCNDCRRCEVFCWDSKKQVLVNNREAKAAAFREGTAPDAVYAFKDNFLENGNFFRTEKTNNQADFNQTYDAYVYAGEYANHYEGKLKDQLGEILNNLGLSFVYDQNETSSGVLACDLGMEELAWRLMEQTYQKISRYNFKCLVTIAPEDYYAFRFEYEKAGFKFKVPVLHYTQLLAQDLDRLKPVAGRPRKYMYFDPCKLGRYGQIYEEPRKVLEKLLGSRCCEFQRNRDQAYCCGGYIRLLDEKISRDISSQVINECQARDCSILITACPLCLSNLKQAKGDLNLTILDIIEVAAGGLTAYN
ncbi:MAG: (Fe-S)-binding protein [Actinomycetota bacterium]|nr:(Fe-S)-binding protein [Actinomycetota bacterium]